MYQRQLSEQKRSEKPSNLKRTRSVDTNTAQVQLPMAINGILGSHRDVFASQINRHTDQHEASPSWQIEFVCGLTEGNGTIYCQQNEIKRPPLITTNPISRPCDTITAVPMLHAVIRLYCIWCSIFILI